MVVQFVNLKPFIKSVTYKYIITITKSGHFCILLMKLMSRYVRKHLLEYRINYLFS